jgi:Domain of unknown function (DUF222)
VSGVCDGDGRPANVAEALRMLDRALDHLNAADAASLPASVQAEMLRALGRAESKHTAARARVLGAFAGQAAYEDDGQGSAGTWLRWQTRVTKGAAAGAVGWARRLAAHPVIGAALAAGELSESWGKQVCAWTDRLPEGRQDDADEILAAAARAGVDLSGLAGLAQEMYERAHHDGDRESELAERGLWLGTTIGGAGRVTGDLTPGCSAALTTVLDSLGARSGPDDIRSVAQRRHDALQEACQRLIGSGMLPGHAGQPAQVQVHMTLSQLRGLPGAAETEAAWVAARAAQPGWLTWPEAQAAACDGSMAPVVTGCVDEAALDRLTGLYLAAHGLQAPHPADSACGAGLTRAGPTGPNLATHGPQPPHLADPAWGAGSPRGPGSLCGAAAPYGAGSACRAGPGRTPLPPATLARLRQTMLRLAADVLSGPGGLASVLRTNCLTGGPGAGRSAPLAIPLPLDTGDAAPAIPPALRRAVLARHVTCCFPGCAVPAAQCHIHHFIPRSQGGRTVLRNLGPVCEFHHLIVVHSWGWTLALNADGTTTATSPNRQRVLHSHSPPSRAA